MNTNEPVTGDSPAPPDVLNWCRALVEMLRHGGTWGIPRSGLVFQIDKNQKQLVLVNGHATDEDFIATQHVFAQIGWTVTAPPAASSSEQLP